MKRRVFYQMFLFTTLFGIVGLCGCQKKLRSEKDRNLSAIEEAQVMIESSMAESRSAERESQSKWAGQTEGVDYDFTKMGTELMQDTIKDVLSNPKKYEGKVFRIQGGYAPRGEKNYCVVEDLYSLLPEGIEFVGDVGSMDHLPSEEMGIEVTGTVKLSDEGGKTKYLLENAGVQWKKIGHHHEE